MYCDIPDWIVDAVRSQDKGDYWCLKIIDGFDNYLPVTVSSPVVYYHLTDQIVWVMVPLNKMQVLTPQKCPINGRSIAI